MKILMLSTDQKIFEAGSEVRRRMIDYGTLIEELHIVVRCQKSDARSQKFNNVFVYPTNSRFKVFYFLDAYKITKKILAASGQWLITSQDPFETSLVGYWLKKKFKISLQIQIHTDFLNRYFWRESFKNKIRVLLAKWLVKKADRIRVVSERIRKSLVTSYQLLVTKIDVLPIFVDIEKIRQAPIEIDLRKKYPGRFIILMASRLTKEKNISMAIEAFVKTKNQKPKTKNPLLLIVGEGPEEQNLKLKTKNLKLEDGVKFEPWTDKLASYYKSADVYLLTSDYEGYGRTAVEAAAAGLPVIMTDVGVAIGKVVPVGDTEALQNALKEFMEDGSARKKVLETQEAILRGWTPYSRYLDEIRAGWKRVLAPPGRRLLFITQKVDADDDLLGVYHEWIRRLAEKVESISVICLFKGRVELPPNVSVYSLGKEQIMGSKLRIAKRLIYVTNFYKYIWRLRDGYDAVFVHMNPEYVILGWKLWKLLGKKIFLWYNHPLGDVWARMAIWASDKIFCTSPFAFAARYKKTELMPVGVDTEKFRPLPSLRAVEALPAGRQESHKNSILYLGRISSIKKLEVLIKAFSVLLSRCPAVILNESEGSQPIRLGRGRDSSPSAQNDKHISNQLKLTIVGGPTPGKSAELEYYEKIRKIVKELNLENVAEFRPPVPNYKAPELYNSHNLSVNMTPTGSFDKAIIESMACETPVIVSNKSLRGILPDNLIFKEGDVEDLAGKIDHFFNLSDDQKSVIGKKLRQAVIEKHSLLALIDKLYPQLASLAG